MLKLILNWINSTPYGIPITIVVVFVCVIMGIASYLFLGMEKDNPLEQSSEYIIESAVGWPSGSIDLSPFDGKNK